MSRREWRGCGAAGGCWPARDGTGVGGPKLGRGSREDLFVGQPDRARRQALAGFQAGNERRGRRCGRLERAARRCDDRAPVLSRKPRRRGRRLASRQCPRIFEFGTYLSELSTFRPSHSARKRRFPPIRPVFPSATANPNLRAELGKALFIGSLSRSLL